MNALPRTRALIAGLGALALLTLGACSSADSDQATATGSTTSVIAPSVSDQQASASGAATTADGGSLGATDGSSAPAPETPDIGTPATTEVPQPGGGGNITETVPEVSRSTAAPVPLTAEAEPTAGVRVSLTSLERVTTTAELPGEIAGPGLKIDVSIVNGSDQPLDLVNVIVDLQDATGVPALPMVSDPAAPFSGTLAAGGTASGVYVFTLPAGYTGPATIAVSYSADTPVVVFTGDSP